jgi:hypothetical protein
MTNDDIRGLDGDVNMALYGFQGADAERDGSCGSLLNGATVLINGPLM